MDTQQITHILSSHVKTKNAFLGVFPSDQLPQNIPNFPACFVANTDTSNKAGLHWVAFYLHSPDELCFMDSYGNPPSYFKGGIENYVKKYHHVVYNPMKLQSNVSSVCGQYCIYFLYSKCNNRSMSDFLLSFVSNELCNDLKVHHFVTKHFKVVVPFYQ